MIKLIFVASLLFITSCSNLLNNIKNDQKHNLDFSKDPRDPLEFINRPIWNFNYMVLDNHLYRPITRIYKDNVHNGLKNGFHAMLLNLSEPNNTVNHLLQLNIVEALNSSMRFIINSTLGAAGYFDVAAELGLVRNSKSFADVLFALGFNDSLYIMLPFLGPKTLLQVIGYTVDTAYFPFSIMSPSQILTWIALDGLDKRYQVMNQELLVDNALDPYLFVKDAYLQYQAYQDHEKQLLEEESIPDSFLNELE